MTYYIALYENTIVNYNNVLFDTFRTTTFRSSKLYESMRVGAMHWGHHKHLVAIWKVKAK